MAKEAVQGPGQPAFRTTIMRQPIQIGLHVGSISCIVILNVMYQPAA